MEFLSGQTLVKKDKTEVSADEALKDKEVVAFYFSAHWCPPCRMFTPILGDFYVEVMEASLPIEIIFISSDKSAEALFDYMKESHGEWLAVPFGSPAIEQIQSKFKVQGIPALIVVKKDGTVISDHGRKDVDTKGVQAAKEWLK